MKFFIPNISNEARAEEMYQAIVSFAKENYNWGVSDRRIFKIAYFDVKSRKDCLIEVGKINNVNGEVVWAILSSDAHYLVCTPRQGAIRGTPMIFDKNEVNDVEEFEQ